MVATQPVNRIGAHFDAPPVAKRVLPKTEHERGKLGSDSDLRRPMTRAQEYVETICEEYHLELAQIPPGEFRRISHAFIDWDCANN